MQYPKHVAIIPDGNRTRAEQNNVSIQEAYRTSYRRGVELVEYTFTQTDIKVFTLWGLSTENTRNRPPQEFDFLMNMYKFVDDTLDQILQNNKVNFKRIGNPTGITAGFKDYLDQKTQKCRFDSDKYFIFAVNYGGRDEIVRGIQKLRQQKESITSIDEHTITGSLDLSDVYPVELIIRTKGNYAHRTSGFMLWRMGYAELFFTDKYCPEFTTHDYQQALQWFDSIFQYRNFGK